MLSWIKEPRILAAREQVTRHFDDMQNHGLIRYSKEVDYYLITTAGEPGFAGAV